MSDQRETLAARTHRLRLNANALRETSRDLVEEAREMIAASRQMRDEAAAKRATSWRMRSGGGGSSADALAAARIELAALVASWS